MCPPVGHWFNTLCYVTFKKDKTDQQLGHRKKATKYCRVKHYPWKYIYRIIP